MNTDDKIGQALAVLQEGQKALQADVTAMQSAAGQSPAIAQQLAQQGQQLDHHNTTLTQHGQLLNGIAATLGTVLEEQQAQRLAMRSLHTEVHASTEEVKAERQAARAEAQRDTVDVKATVVEPLKDHAKRLDALEDAAGIPHPDNNESSSLRAHETRNAPSSPSVDHSLFSTEPSMRDIMAVIRSSRTWGRRVADTLACLSFVACRPSGTGAQAGV